MVIVQIIMVFQFECKTGDQAEMENPERSSGFFWKLDVAFRLSSFQRLQKEFYLDGNPSPHKSYASKVKPVFLKPCPQPRS